LISLGELAATTLKITIENDANAAAYGEYTMRAKPQRFFVTLAGRRRRVDFDGKSDAARAVSLANRDIVAVNSDGMKLSSPNANIIRRTKNRFIRTQHTSSLGKA